MGLAAYAGSVPTPSDQADLAATSIGQGRVLVSPLNMAMVAAAVDTGTVRAPRLVTGAPDDTAATHRLPADGGHRPAPDDGAGRRVRHRGGPGPAGRDVRRRRGPPSTGPSNPLKIDAWLIGFRGNIAFAVLVVDANGDGGPTGRPDRRQVPEGHGFVAGSPGALAGLGGGERRWAAWGSLTITHVHAALTFSSCAG